MTALVKELLLKVENVKVHFDIPVKNGWPWTPPRKLKAVDGVNFELYKGETLGIVGESGCGKSTLARAVIRMLDTVEGNITWLGEDITHLKSKALKSKRKEMQMIFQDPLASLNPRMTVGDIIAEPLITHYPEVPKAEVKARVRKMMERVGLLSNQINRYPHEFSGGQCQRIGIARALILEPKLIVCDEPVSALDVSIQAQVVNLLQEIQQEMGLSLLFIAHDLSVVKHISDRIMVLYLGNVMEVADYQHIYDQPRHPYTQALISAVPIPDPEIESNKEVIVLDGDLPSPINPPSGCVFRTRCPRATEKCAQDKPELVQAGVGHQVACHFHD